MSDQNVKYQSINLQDVSGGMNTAQPPNDIADNEFVLLENLEYNKSGELTTRPGMTAVSSAATSIVLKGMINNIKIDSPTKLAYDADSNLLFVCDTGATDVVFIVDITDPEKPIFKGSCKDGAMVYPVDAVKHGDYLLVADRWNGSVHVFDISDPANSTWVRKHTDATNLDWIHQIIRDGDYLYCANDDAGAHGSLVVLDISDLGTGISESNKITAHSGGKWIAHVPDTNRLYQTNQGTDELHVFDVSNPAAISLVVSHLDAVALNDVGPVQADENYVYMLSATDDTFIVLDASDEVTVTITATLVDAVRLNKIDTWTYKRGNIIICPCYWSDSLTMVNIADPTAPVIISDIMIPGRLDQIIDAVLVDDYLFMVSAADDYLLCVKLHVPLPFQTVTSDAYTSAFGYVSRATPDDRWVVAYEHGAVKVIRVFDREDPAIIKEVDYDNPGSYFVAGGYTYDYVVDVCWNPAMTRLYAWVSLNAGGQAGIVIYSFNSSTGKIAVLRDSSDDPIAVAFSDGGGSGGCGFYFGDDGLPYVATANGSASSKNILIISVENDTPTQVGKYTWTGQASRAEINPVEKILYASSATILSTFDISDPAAPILGNDVATARANKFILQRDYTTIWGFDVASSIVTEWDLSDPLLPVVKKAASFPLMDRANEWPWHDANTDTLYIGSGSSDALVLINVSSWPWIQEYVYVDAVNLASPAGVHLKDGYVFSTDISALVTIIRAEVVQNFTLKWELSNVPLDEVWCVKHYGQTLAAASKTSDAISIIDIREPASLKQYGQITDATKLNGAVDLAWFGGGKYIIAASKTYNGVVVYDVSNPLGITEMSFITTVSLTSCNAVVVDAKEEFAYVSAPGYLNVIDIRLPGSITLVAALHKATKYAALDGLVFLDADYLCGIGTNYINVWDVKIPFSPYLIGSLNDASQPAMRCDSDGTYLYATTNAGNSVRIYDISDVTAPVFDNEIASLTGAYGIRYVPVDKILWVGVPGATKISLYDVSDPTAPVLLDDLVDSANLAGCKLVDAAGFDIYCPCSTIDRITALRVVGMPFRSIVSSIFQLKNEQGVDALVVTEGNHVLTEIGSGIFEVINGALKIPVDGFWRWGVLDGVLFGVHGVSPQVIDDDGVVTKFGYSQVVYWDGETSSLQEVQNFPEQEVAATQLEVWNHRLFILAGNSVFYSKLGDGTDFTDTLAGSLDVFPDDGDIASGMEAHKGMLVIFKRKHIYRILAGVPNTADSKWSLELVTKNSGAVSGESTKSVLDDLLFLSSEGLTTLGSAEKLGDFETVLLSKKISDLRGMKLSNLRFPALYWPKKSQYWISIDTDNDGVVDKTYVLDMKDSLNGKLKWTVFTGAIVGTAFAIVEVDGVNELYIGSDKLYKQDESVWTDAGTPFTTRIKTKEFDLQVPDRRKEILRWGIEVVKRTAALTLTVNLLYDGVTTPVHTYTIDTGAAATGLPLFIRKLITGRRRWKRLQVDVVNAGAEAFELESQYFEITPLTGKRARSL